MIQKKNQAARISDMEVLSDLLKDTKDAKDTRAGRPDSPASRTTKPSQADELVQAPITKTPEPASHPQPNHHPQVIDSDVENFTTRLDTLICQFRNESLKEFLTVKRSILHEQISTIEAEKKRCSALVSSKQDEIQHLTEQLNRTTKAYSQDESQKDSLSLMLGTVKLRHSSLKLKTQCYLSWLAYHNRRSHKKKTEKLVGRLYRRAVFNFVFVPWKTNWKSFSARKAQKRFSDSLEAEKASIAMHFNKEIEMLRNRLEDAERKVQSEEDAKLAIQENLKKAFMRGVCAMNFEAMNILNPNAESPGQAFGQAAKIDFFDVGQNLQTRVEVKEQREQRETREIRELRDGQVGEGTPVKGVPEIYEIGNGLPAESKELKWKAAPVFGRPQTAQVISNDGIFGIGLPVVNSGNQSEGKVIVVNNAKAQEVKITGKIPVKSAMVKKSK